MTRLFEFKVTFTKSRFQKDHLHYKIDSTLGTCHILNQEQYIVESRVAVWMLNHSLSLRDLLIPTHKINKLYAER